LPWPGLLQRDSACPASPAPSRSHGTWPGWSWATG